MRPDPPCKFPGRRSNIALCNFEWGQNQTAVRGMVGGVDHVSSLKLVLIESPGVLQAAMPSDQPLRTPVGVVY